MHMKRIQNHPKGETAMLVFDSIAQSTRCLRLPAPLVQILYIHYRRFAFLLIGA